MHFTQKIHQFVSRIIFKHMISLNKIQIHSTLLAVVFLSLKSILGIWMILTIFIAGDDIVISIFVPVRNYFEFSQGELMSTDIALTVIFTILNTFSLILYFNPLRFINFDFSKFHLYLMLFLESVQYMIIVIMCSNISNYIVKGQYILVLLEAFNLIVLVGSLLLFKGFYFTISHGVKNILGRFPSTHNAMVEAVTMGMTAMLTFIGQVGLNLTGKVIINIIFILLKLLTINYSLRKWYYIHSFIQCLFAFLQITQTLALLCNLILEISDQTLLEQNYYVSVFITASFCFLGWRNFFIHEQQSLYFYKGKDIRQITEAVLYFKALYDLSGLGESQNDDSPVILSSIRRQHQLQCNNKNCYCQSQGSSEDDDNFAKNYIIEQLDDLRVHFKNQPKILIQELNFRFKMYSTYPQVLTHLTKIKNHFTLGIMQHFSIQSLKTDLIEYMEVRNRAANTIDIETPLNLQQTTADIQKIIQKDIQKKNNKWMYLSKGLCRTEELEQDIKTQIGFIKQITQIQNQWNTRMKRSTLFNYLLLFYYRKVSFLNVNVDQIFKNLNQAMKKIKEEELSSVKEFSKCLFHKRSCVIQSPINEDNMGIVTRASKNVYDLFGYHPNKIIGINLNRLMPNFMAIQHDIILSEWVKNGTWRTVGKLKEIFCIHKEQYCFNALLYLKIIANQKGLFFMTVVFKKNESDYLILNDKKQIEGIGRKFLHVIGSNCRRMPVEVLFNDFPENQIPKNFEYKSFTRVFRSFRNNEQLVDEFFQQKSLLFQRDITMDQLVRMYRQKLYTSLNFERWQVKFDAKLYKMREVRYYVILMNTARLVEGNDSRSMTTYDQGKFQNILVGHGKMNEDEDSSFDNSKNSSKSTAGRNQARFIDAQGGSSVASFAGRQSFTLNKLLSVFFSYLIEPRNIKDRRIDILNWSTLVETLLLTGIITFSFVAYNGNMKDIGQYIQADGTVNENMQRVMLLYNRVISFQEYREDQVKLSWVLDDALVDMYDFYESTGQQLANLQTTLSVYSGQKLYSYLNNLMNWDYRDNFSPFILQALMFFEFYYYMAGSIAIDVYSDVSINLVRDRMYEMGLIKDNFPQYQIKLVEFPRNFLSLVEQSISRCTLISLLMTVSFLIITFFFFLFICNYHRFRNEQKYQALHLYEIIPNQLIESLKNYYFELYNFVNRSHNKSTGIQVDPQNFSQNYLNIQQKLYNMGNTHIKFLGRKPFYGWIKPFIIFLISNAIYIVITYEIIQFIAPLDQLMIDVNQIMDSQNKLYESYLEMKSSYLLSPQPQFTDQIFNNIIEVVGQNQVVFDKATTFNSDILTNYDSSFYDDFKNILVTNVCDEIKDQITDVQYSYCQGWTSTSMISQGVITFMNHLQRKLRTAVIDLQLNLQQRFQAEGQNYFINRGFQDIDFVMTYNIKVFKKLTNRIVQAYQKGVDYITLVNYIIVMLLITPQVISIIFWFQLALSQKNKLSFLFGSILTIPPQLIRQVKNLPRLTKKILEFEQT